ncbi:hypothetical protein LY78DRAFT_681311 [Colletotrichum sublineola]|nr:hypothetical protein LY78DRAFT_681311 [Colletotrichum sublineola]
MSPDLWPSSHTLPTQPSSRGAGLSDDDSGLKRRSIDQNSLKDRAKFRGTASVTARTCTVFVAASLQSFEVESFTSIPFSCVHEPIDCSMGQCLDGTRGYIQHVALARPPARSTFLAEPLRHRCLCPVLLRSPRRRTSGAKQPRVERRGRRARLWQAQQDGGLLAMFIGRLSAELH